MKYIKLFENVNKTVSELDSEYDYFHLSHDRYIEYNVYDPSDLNRIVPRFS